MGLIDNVLGARGGTGGGGMSPITMALVGLLAYRTFQGKGRLADMLGHHAEGSVAPAPGAPAAGGGLGGMLGGLMGGGLGGMLGGGGAGGMLSGGLADLVQQFQQNGQGDKAESWVGSGANKPVAPHELEQALGEERIAWLMQQTGLPRDQLLQGLSRELPQAVDRLTPQGRLPTEQEAHGMWSDAR
jgi:uncharacterized protein YidB (DUF937 family)